MTGPTGPTGPMRWDQMHLLAQGRGGGGYTTDAIAWSLVLIGAVVVLFVAVMWFRRWMTTDDTPEAGALGFTLSDLRELHRRGEMSDAEYEQAKAKMLGQARAQTAAMPDPAGGRRAPGAAPGGAPASPTSPAPPPPSDAPATGPDTSSGNSGPERA